MCFGATFAVHDGFLPEVRCAELLEAVRAEIPRADAPPIERAREGRSLRYRVLDGPRVKERLPEFVEACRKVGPLAREAAGRPVVPISNVAAAVNVNVKPPGGEYRWHYDRNEVEGGETELYPGSRLDLGRWRTSGAQAALDALLQRATLRRLFGRLVRVAPRPGRLVLMRGTRCLHSVVAIRGREDRVNVILCFDDPGAAFAQERDLARIIREALKTRVAGLAFGLHLERC